MDKNATGIAVIAVLLLIIVALTIRESIKRPRRRNAGGDGSPDVWNEQTGTGRGSTYDSDGGGSDGGGGD